MKRKVFYETYGTKFIKATRTDVAIRNLLGLETYKFYLTDSLKNMLSWIAYYSRNKNQLLFTQEGEYVLMWDGYL